MQTSEVYEQAMRDRARRAEIGEGACAGSAEEGTGMRDVENECMRASMREREEGRLWLCGTGSALETKP